MLDLSKLLDQAENHKSQIALPTQGDNFSRGIIFALAVIMGVGGALPHVFFASDFGPGNFYEGAWDESFYALVASGKLLAWNDYPARFLVKWLIDATGGPNLMFGLLSDLIWPALAVLAAGFLTLTITRSWAAVLPVTLLLVFASDILPFNSSAIYPKVLTLSHTLRTLSLDIRRVFSDSFVSFLYTYRTPEPQLSLPFFLVYLALTIRFLRQPRPSASCWLIYAAASLICTGIYVFNAAACILIAAAAAVSLLFARRHLQALGATVIAIGSAAFFALQVLGSHSGEASAMLFSSSLPLIAPSLIYGAMLAPAFAWQFRRSLFDDPVLFFALLCILLPFATMNYQVFLGFMIQSVNWERYVNYPCLVVGTCLFLNQVNAWRGIQQIKDLLLQLSPSLQKHTSAPYPIQPVSRWSLRALSERQSILRISTAVLFLALTALFIWRVQLSNYKQYARHNVLTLASAKLIDEAFKAKPDSARYVTLFDASLDAAIMARLHSTGIIFNAYNSLVLSMKEPEPNSGQAAGSASQALLHQQWGFDHAARLGLSRSDYQSKMLKEIENNNCWPHLMFHYSFLECAPYVSDFRAYYPEKLKLRIPLIGQQYEEYIASYTRTNARGALVVLTSPSLATQVSGLWYQVPAGRIKMSSPAKGFAPAVTVEVYGYWQTPIK